MLAGRVVDCASDPFTRRFNIGKRDHARLTSKRCLRRGQARNRDPEWAATHII